ncbi:MAG: hypothetical protein HQ519_04565 [Planctomycetes bacterium]|nr:hypothetical protein [Planctomycetota bacterium]
MLKRLITLVVLLLCLSAGSAAHMQTSGTTASQIHSELWGDGGDLWRPDSRLPDFSFAGYHRGETEIPAVPQVCSVKDFGAVGDGIADDTQAFLDAIAATESGAIFIPAGRFKLTKIIEIQKSNLVLRGAGPTKTTLHFPTPLNEIKPNWGATTGGQRTSNYSWSGGLIWVKGNYRNQKLADVTGVAKRGDFSLEVSSSKPFAAGQQIEISLQDNSEKTLTRHLYSGDPGDMKKFAGAKVSMVVKITEISADKIHFDRPLRFDVRSEWKPQIQRFEPTVKEVGIENLSFEFPVQDYDGHFSEPGFNAVALSGVSDCWVRNIEIKNADSGIFVGANFCTISGVQFESKRAPNRDCTGHHGIILGGNDNLFTNFEFRTKFIHDLGVSANDSGNVFSNSKGIDLNFDHHRRAPFENLFTNLDVGAGTRMWHCGGGASLGKHCAARGTFWNIRAAQPQQYPPSKFGPLSMNLVAIETEQASIKDPAGKWFEAIAPQQIAPQNLHEAQLKSRLE